MKLRKAKVSDIPQIHKLINFYANERLLLPRALSELYDTLQTFFVIEEKGKVVACCSLHVTWDNLAEIRSLAVDKKYQNKGYGHKFLLRCFQEAKQLGVTKLFVLTFVPSFFKKYGFREISRDKLPHKVWSDCIKCPFFPNCNEVPLLYEINKKLR